MRVAGRVLHLHPFYMGEERRQAEGTFEDFRRLVESKAFQERRHAIGHDGNGGGGSHKTFMAVMFVGGIALAQAVNFINNRVLDSAFSREPPFTAEWKDATNARMLKVEMSLQTHEGKLAIQESRQQAQDARLQMIERKLDALLWKAQIDPDTLRGR